MNQLRSEKKVAENVKVKVKEEGGGGMLLQAQIWTSKEVRVLALEVRVVTIVEQVLLLVRLNLSTNSWLSWPEETSHWILYIISGSNGTASKDLLPPPAAASSVIKDSKDKDKKEDKSKDAEKDKDKDKKEGKDVANSSISSTASTTSAKFTTSNFVETVSCVLHSYGFL